MAVTRIAMAAVMVAVMAEAEAAVMVVVAAAVENDHNIAGLIIHRNSSGTIVETLAVFPTTEISYPRGW